MEDNQIIELYWNRSEAAISETMAKYGKFCRIIAYHILYDEQDAQECANDTYLAAWNSMPPHRPSVLPAFLGKITRGIAIDRWRMLSAAKRGGGEVSLALDELEDCVASGHDVERRAEEKEMISAINRFLSTLSRDERDVFVCRYFFLLSVAEICDRFGFSQSKLKSMLSRTRKKLRVKFEKEGLL